MIRLRSHFLKEILAWSASCVKELESHIESSIYLLYLMMKIRKQGNEHYIILKQHKSCLDAIFFQGKKHAG